MTLPDGKILIAYRYLSSSENDPLYFKLNFESETVEWAKRHDWTSSSWESDPTHMTVDTNDESIVYILELKKYQNKAVLLTLNHTIGTISTKVTELKEVDECNRIIQQNLYNLFFICKSGSTSALIRYSTLTQEIDMILSSYYYLLNDFVSINDIDGNTYKIMVAGAMYNKEKSSIFKTLFDFPYVLPIFVNLSENISYYEAFRNDEFVDFSAEYPSFYQVTLSINQQTPGESVPNFTSNQTVVSDAAYYLYLGNPFTFKINF